jgi:hypothetical protein
MTTPGTRLTMTPSFAALVAFILATPGTGFARGRFLWAADCFWCENENSAIEKLKI